jgi:dolichyl-phosphate beta-glucosyltransferase
MPVAQAEMKRRLRARATDGDFPRMTELAAAPHLTLVVPCYNGEERLPVALAQLSAFLALQPYSSELVLVDDCSAEPAARILREYTATRPGIRLLRNEQNLGKGKSVSRGMLAGRGRFRVFTDADLAYPPEEANKILRDLEAGADVAIACRVLPESRYLMSPSFFHYLYTRHVMSRVFNLLVRGVLLRGVLDSQAGLKGFTANATETVFPRVTIPRFGFDVEALFIAQKHRLAVHQTAVYFRYDEEPTTVKFAQSAFTMAMELLQIRMNDWRGRYD